MDQLAQAIVVLVFLGLDLGVKPFLSVVVGTEFVDVIWIKFFMRKEFYSVY